MKYYIENTLGVTLSLGAPWNAGECRWCGLTRRKSPSVDHKFPERLDDALIRPGRIDIKVNFTMATRSQICELFTRMYSPKDHPSALATCELKEVAEKFAAQLDEKSFTPAEVQGFLLTRKIDPMKALREVEAWKN